MEFRHALRALGHAPVLTAALVLSLGLGVGANAAVFNLISTLLLRPPAGITDAGSLAVVGTLRSGDGEPGLASHADLAAIKTSRAFDDVAAYDDRRATSVTIDGTLRLARVADVTPNLFPLLGLRAHAGTLVPAPGTAVISYQLWDSAGRPSLEDAQAAITIDGTVLTVSGVAPERFRGLHAGRATDVWRLLAPGEPDAPGTRTLSLVARTRDHNVSTSELEGPYRVRPYGFMDPEQTPGAGLLALVLGGATALVLLCAAVNAASLMLSRGNARRRDFAVKLALGATRAAIVRQLLLEGALVGLAGALAGLLFAGWTTTIVPSLFAPEHAEMLDARLSRSVIASTVAGATLLGLVLGALPALHGTTPVTALDLRGDAGAIAPPGAATRLQTTLVTLQIACSTVLLISALLLSRGLAESLEGELGPAARYVSVATISEPPMSVNPIEGRQNFGQIASQVLATPGVASAGFAATLPLGVPFRGAFMIGDTPGATPTFDADMNIVSPGYFETMQLRMLEGRTFTPADSGLAPAVAIVNEPAMRAQLGSSATGRTLLDTHGTPITIVGVVADRRFRTMQESASPMIYRPLAQEYSPRMQLVVRAGILPSPDFFRVVRPALRAGNMQMIRILSLEQFFAEALVLDRLVTALVSACGLMALLLAIMGAYTLMMDSVQRRTREIGLRMALGAGSLRISRGILRYGMTITVVGVAAGLAFTLAAGRVARMFVRALPQADMWTASTAAGTVLVVVLIAAVVPVVRATRVNPTIALRHS